jgi:hypothetical protein
VCFHRLGRLRDRTAEAQQHRAGGLALVTAASIAGLGVSAMTLYAIEVSVVLGAFVVMYVAHHRREQEDHQDSGPVRSRPAR